MNLKNNKGIQLLSDYLFYKNYSQKKPNGELETWDESLDRIYGMHRNFLLYKGYNMNIFQPILDRAKEFESKKKFLTSQRNRQWASTKFTEGTLKNNFRSFNCLSTHVDRIRVFSEIIYAMLSGAGVGYSLHKGNTSKLPKVAENITISSGIYSIEDSCEGIAEGINVLMHSIFGDGVIPTFDYSQIRPKGSLINGKFKAPGHEPTKQAIDNIISLARQAEGRQFTNLELHRIICFLAESVVSAGLRRCLPEDSMVHTRKGMIPIKDIQIGEEVLTSDGYKKVLNKFHQGYQKLVRIKTQDSWFDCTPNHKMAVLNGVDKYEWKEARELEEGDRLIAPSVGVEGVTTHLKSNTSNYLLTPPLDPDLAWFIGFFQINGKVIFESDRQFIKVKCNTKDHNIYNKLKEQFDRFGIVIYTIENEHSITYYTTDLKLTSYFFSSINGYSKTSKVKEYIWRAKKDIKLYYLQGIFDACGNTISSPNKLLTTKYKKFAEDIRILASSCGIQLRLIVEPNNIIEEDNSTKFSVVFTNQRAKEHFQFGVKKANITSKEVFNNTYPKEFLDFKYEGNYNWSLTDAKLIPVSVHSVVELDKVEDTWDIEVEDNHEFFCNGYLTHNSASIALFDKDDTEMLNCKVGDWYNTNRELAMANNSTILLYGDNTSFSEYKELLEYSKVYGEPAIAKFISYDYTGNPS